MTEGWTVRRQRVWRFVRENSNGRSIGMLDAPSDGNVQRQTMPCEMLLFLQRECSAVLL